MTYTSNATNVVCRTRDAESRQEPWTNDASSREPSIPSNMIAS